MNLPLTLPLYRSAETEALWRVTAFGDQRVPPGRRYWFDNHRRAPTGVVVVQATLEGSLLFRDEQGEHHAGPGQIVLFAYGEPTSYGLRPRRETPYACRWINLQGAGLLEHLAGLRAIHGPVLEAAPGWPLVKHMSDLIAHAGPQVTASPIETARAVHRFVMRLFEHAERRMLESLSPVERAVEQILRRPAQPVSLQELADHHGCSREHLTRVFRQRTGQTPAAFLNQARLRRALRLIAQTDLPLKAIAEQAGFSSAHTMTRHIRRATGRSASDLRRRPDRIPLSPDRGP